MKRSDPPPLSSSSSYEFVTRKLASFRSPPESIDSASEFSEKISELKSAIPCQKNEDERKGTRREYIPTKPKKLDLSSGISKKAYDIINSIRQSSSSIADAADISENPSKFDHCKDFLRRSDAPTLFDATSSSSKKVKKFPTSKSISSLGSVLVENKSVVTEVHSGVNIKYNTNSVGAGCDDNCVEDEVEIVSLLEEQIPKYKLRADTITQFSGYQNEDFVGIPFPVLKDFSPVTPEQAYLTLGYFLLSGSRVSQMTKTFADVDALQKLLEEKERDLELAARIGQQLLEQNQALREKVTVLEIENKENIENITQLKYELKYNAQLLELYNDTTESAETSKAVTPVGSVATVLEKRLQLLEGENQSLRSEACQLAEEVEKTEAHEKYLVEDAISKISESNQRITRLSNELQIKTEEAKAQQDELVALEEELKNYQVANRDLVGENTELRKLVDVLSNNQNQLGAEIIDLKENYIEVVCILKETQEQLREAQRQKEEGRDVVTVFDSLAYEIDSSVARQRGSSDYFRRTFDTVRCANSKLSDPSISSSALMSTTSNFNSSGLSSFDSAHELMHSNFNSLILESGLGSSLCYSPGSSTPGGSNWRLPEKLQIIKPLEGSSTLQVWSTLATPHLGNLLEKRPGVQTRVERPIEGISANTILALTSESSAVIVSTPTAFTFVTTSSIRESSPLAVHSSTAMSSRASSCSLSSTQSVLDGSSSPVPTPPLSHSKHQGSSSSFYTSADYLKCETPQNSPMEGNSRPMSPSFKQDNENSPNNRTLKTLYAVYDTLCSKLSGLGSPVRSVDIAQPQKYDLTTKLGRLEVSFESSRFQAPPKPGTGVLQKILLEPD